jgi:hypothetical protein
VRRISIPNGAFEEVLKKDVTKAEKDRPIETITHFKGGIDRGIGSRSQKGNY